MLGGVNTPGADLTQHLMALCVYIPSVSNSKVCVHSFPLRVFQQDLADLVTRVLSPAVFFSLCTFSTLFSVPRGLSAEQLGQRLLSQGSASGGTQTKTCSSSVLTARHFLPGRKKYSMQKKQQLNEKQNTVFSKSWVSTQCSPVHGSEMLGGESEFRLKEGS